MLVVYGQYATQSTIMIQTRGRCDCLVLLDETSHQYYVDKNQFDNEILIYFTYLERQQIDVRHVCVYSDTDQSVGTGIDLYSLYYAALVIAGKYVEVSKRGYWKVLSGSNVWFFRQGKIKYGEGWLNIKPAAFIQFIICSMSTQYCLELISSFTATYRKHLLDSDLAFMTSISRR